MTEAEWLTSDDPVAILRCVVPNSSPRKLRLVSCAFAREVWPLLTDVRNRNTVEAAEQYADDSVRSAHDEMQFNRARAGGMRAVQAARSLPDRGAVLRVAAEAAYGTSVKDDRLRYSVFGVLSNSSHAVKTDGGYQNWNPHPWCDLIRCVFGNPFRPMTPDPSWLTSTVVQLASGIYADREFDRLPILADALQDAGCEATAVLEHCRGAGPHARGCWVVDMLTGRS